MKHISHYLTSYPHVDLGDRCTPVSKPRRAKMVSTLPQLFIYVIKPFFAFVLWTCLIVQAFDTGFYYNDQDYTDVPTSGASTYIGGIIKSGTVYNDSLTVRLIQRFYDADFNPDMTQPAIYYIKFLIDVALSFIAFIALCFLIYYLYMIFFSDHDEGVSQAKGYALNAFIAICLIGLSWMIVSFAFYIYNLFLGF